jgi:hypothetical protein
MKTGLVALAAVVCWPMLVRAEHADIVLRVFHLDSSTGRTDEATAYADQEPPAGGVKTRPLYKVKARDPLVLQFILTNTYPHGVNKNVQVRYYVVRVDKTEQKIVPALDGGAVVTRGQFQMNFKPKCRVGARVAFAVPNPGIYLVRVDTLNTSSDHEHFSAIDLKVE